MNLNPLVTIVMATFNRAHLIEESLLTIQNQTYENWECLIIDDGSTDATQEVLKPYLKKDPRFQYIHRTENYKKGLPGCRNYGLDSAKGEFVIFFDDDDIVHPQNLELCVAVLRNNLYDFCVYKKRSFNDIFNFQFDQQFVEENNKKINLYNFLTNKVSIASCTVMWSFSCFEKIRFNETLMYAEEWECYSRVLMSNQKGKHISNILYYNRKHKNSNTGEFWNHDPIRRESKVEACRLVIKHLAKQKKLTYQLGVYFVSMAHFLNEKRVFNYVRIHKKAFNIFDYLKLNLRYYGKDIISPFYKLKKRFT